MELGKKVGLVCFMMTGNQAEKANVFEQTRRDGQRSEEEVTKVMSISSKILGIKG